MSERELGMWKRDILARYNENYNVLNKSNFSFKISEIRRKKYYRDRYNASWILT